MKYIIVFLLLSSSLFSDLLEKNEGNSIVINYDNTDFYHENQIVFFQYKDDGTGPYLRPSVPKTELSVLKTTNDISYLKENEEGFYVIGKNTDLKRFEITGLLPNRQFIIHFINEETGEYKYKGNLRSTTNDLEPIEPPRALQILKTSSNMVELDWTQPEDADGTMIIVSKDRIPQLPIDGIKYEANLKYGTNYTVVDGITYTVFFGNKTGETVVVDNLEEDGVYYFLALSYNGDKFNFNYNTNATSENTIVFNKGNVQE